jgi:O-glycosyl hydrolase
MGNPLLDIQVRNGEDLLKKYNLNANDAILADEKHFPMLDILSLHLYIFSMLIPPFPLKKAMMRSSRNTRWSTSLVVQRRMLLEVQLYVPHSPFPFLSF